MTKEDSEYHRKRGAEIVAQIQAARVNPEYAAGVRDERKRIVDMLKERNRHEGRQNFYAYIIKLIEESA